MEPQMVVRIMANIDGLKEALAQGGSAIQNTTAGMQRMVASFSGDKLIQQAVNMAAAIAEIGGASKLTERELERANAVFEKAAQKMEALGTDGAAQMRSLADATAKVPPQAEQAQSAFQKFSNTLAGDFKTQFTAMVTGFVTAEAVIGAAKAIFGTWVDFLKGSIQSYAAAEQAQRKLTVAIEAQGVSVPKTIDQYNKLSLAFQRTTVFGDDLITEMQALLVQVGDVMPNEMEAALTAATDLASGLGIDLRQATMLVGKAFEGETGALKRYGIVIDETKLKTEGVTAVLDAIQGKFGGQAKAEVETYAGSLKQLANEWDNLQEEVGKALVEQGGMVTGIQALKNLIIESIPWVKLFAENLPGLKNTQETITFFDLVGRGLQRIREELGLITRIPVANSPLKDLFPPPGPLSMTADEIERINAELDRSIARQKETSKAAADHAKAIAALRDELTGRGAIKALENWAQAVKAEGGLTKVSAEGLEKLTTAVKNAAGATVPLTANARALVTELMRLGLLEPPLVRDTDALVDSLKDLGKVANDDVSWLKMLAEDGIKKLSVATREGAAEFERMLKGLGKLSEEEAPKATQQLITLGEALDIAAGLVQQLGGNTLKATVALGALNIASAAAAGSVAGAMGGAISLGLALKQSFDEAEAQGRQFAAMLADLNDQLEDQFGSFSEAQRAAQRYGLALDEVRTKYAAITANGFMRVGSGSNSDEDRMRRFQDQVDDLLDSVTRAEDAVRKYGLAWRDIPNMDQRMNAAVMAGKDLVATLDLLVKSGYDVSAAVIGMSDDINDWLEQVLDAGVKLPEQFRPILETLIRTGQITEENARRMLGLAVETLPTMEQLTAAAERYGLTLDDLGNKAKQVEVTSTAKQLLADWEILSRVTSDWSVLFEAMGEDVQALVNDAIRYGAELPAGMKPMIQAFIDAGQLVDENGNKLTDLSQLNWAMDMAEMVDLLIAKLDELITRVTGIPPAVGGIGTSARQSITQMEESATKAAESMTEASQAAETVVGEDIVEAADDAKQALFDAGEIGVEAWANVAEETDEARMRLQRIMRESGDFQTMTEANDYGAPFRDMERDIRSATAALDALSRSGGVTASSSFAFDAAVGSPFSQAVARTSIPGPLAGDARALDELRAIRRELAQSQPDIVVVPMIAGSVDEFEARMSDRLPRRVLQSDRLRTAWNRAINGTM